MCMHVVPCSTPKSTDSVVVPYIRISASSAELYYKYYTYGARRLNRSG